MTENALTWPMPSTSVVSVKDASTEALTRAIHSPGDEAYVLDRTRTCLSCFFEPDLSPEGRAAMMDEFGRALKGFPRWAVARAYDTWMRTMHRRPSPGEIVVLVGREMKVLTDEVARRERLSQPAPDPQPDRPSRETANRILEEAGWTPKRMEAIRQAHPLARSVDEQAEPVRAKHWSETAPPDDPRWAALQRARAELAK